MSRDKPLPHDPANWSGEVVIPLDPPHADARGAIVPLVDAHMRSAVLISSKKGTVRANHYHRTDWHYCYVLEGAIDYYHRPVGAKTPPEKVRIGRGHLFFTPPMVEHAMVFAEDTVFLTLGGNPRDQTSYEADVVRVRLVDPAGGA
ncbi:MAG: cupin domain-containing protein [Proteobacteria bacterium]|nr:cupin domain-containing protein [Pseudomonadota bacterium]